MADRRIGSDHTPMQKRRGKSKTRKAQSGARKQPVLRQVGGQAETESLRARLRTHRRGSVRPSASHSGPTAYPAGSEPKGSSSPHMRIYSIGGHCLPSERTTEDLQSCKSTDTSAAQMAPLACYVKREKPGFDWAFLRASITSALLPRAHRQPAGGMSVDEYR